MFAPLGFVVTATDRGTNLVGFDTHKGFYLLTSVTFIQFARNYHHMKKR